MTLDLKPTLEQTTAIEVSRTGDNFTIEAGAGTGKTSTLRLISEASPEKSILYLAYNASIARESAQSFPPNAECRTAHSVAYRWTAARWGGNELRSRLSSPRVPARETARMLRSNYPLRVADDLVLAPERIASLAMRTVQRWCYTGDEKITSFHVPEIPRIDSDSSRSTLADAVVPMARLAWEDLSRPNGSLRFAHDHYLKLWALHRPELPFDFILVDEAQDSNGVVTSVVGHQTTQVAAVGDRCQSIYGWRGAVDSMDAFGSKHHVYLTQSFRFGQAIADEANKWLEILGAKLRLVGARDLASRVDEESSARAVLCRTNAEAISTLIACHATGIKVALVGDGREVASLARAARELMDRGSTSHPELFAFVSWGQVQEYVDEAYDGGELGVLVRLIEKYTPEGVIKAIEDCCNESEARVTVSTAHKAKGREWESVRIADDFKEDFESLSDVDGSEAMLAYVAVTRAQQSLNRRGLKWVDALLSPAGVSS